MKTFIISLSIFLLPHFCHSHGVTGTFEKGGIFVIAHYDDGEAFSYAETTIMAPDSNLPFASGWTDRNGRFCFYPDEVGEYIATIQDKMGHRVEIKIPYKEDMNASLTEEKEMASLQTNGHFEKKVLALSIIFWIFGFFFWWKGKNSLYKKQATTTN